MSTPRFLDQNGLDGVLPEKKTFPKALVWVALIVILLTSLLLVFFYTTKGDTDSNQSKSSEKIIQTELNTNLVSDAKEIVLEGKELASDIVLSVDNHSVDQLQASANRPPIVLNTVVTTAKEKIDNISLPDDSKNEIPENSNSSENIIALKQANVSEVTKDKVIATISPSYQYIFKLSSSKLKGITVEEDSRLTRFIEQCNNGTVIVGHTCNVGSTAFNYQLGLERATSMKQHLVELGINPNELTLRSAGMNQPIANNNTKSGRVLNRRVELLCK